MNGLNKIIHNKTNIMQDPNELTPQQKAWNDLMLQELQTTEDLEHADEEDYEDEGRVVSIRPEYNEDWDELDDGDESDSDHYDWL